MEATAIIAIVDAAISIIEKLAPSIQELVQKGQITAAQQQAWLDKIATLRSGDAFSGPEWKQSTLP